MVWFVPVMKIQLYFCNIQLIGKYTSGLFGTAVHMLGFNGGRYISSTERNS